MKAVDIWGACPYREITKVGRPRGWRYICRKTYGTCDPNYCLGPDEEGLLGKKAGKVILDEFIGGTDED